MVKGYTGIEDHQVYWVGRGQSFARMGSQRVARVAVIQTLDTKICSKRKPWPNLVRVVCRARAFVSGFNIVAGRPGYLLSHARLLIFFRVRK